MKILQGKTFRMPEAILHFGQVFWHKLVGDMTIVTGGDGMMTGLLPTIILLTHNMAVDACSGVVGEIGDSLGIIKRVATEADEETQASA
jgi:hypothetical protein